MGFLCREKDRGAKLVIEMVGALTQITDPDNPGKESYILSSSRCRNVYLLQDFGVKIHYMAFTYLELIVLFSTILTNSHRKPA